MVDLHGYEQALRHDPKLAAAADDQGPAERQPKPYASAAPSDFAAVAAIALLVGFVLMMLRSRRQVVRTAS